MRWRLVSISDFKSNCAAESIAMSDSRLFAKFAHIWSTKFIMIAPVAFVLAQTLPSIDFCLSLWRKTFPPLNADFTVEASWFHLRICVPNALLITLFCNLTRFEWYSQIWIGISHLKTLFSQYNPLYKDFPSMLRSTTRNTSVSPLGSSFY